MNILPHSAIPANSPLALLLAELSRRSSGLRRTPSGWQARCPAHDDKNPSLSLAEGDDGRVLLHCHAGCDPHEVLTALGLKFRDLFPRDGSRRKGV